MGTRRDTPARYPIRAVSKLTGIGIDTLRAWERRYGAVTPVRDNRGRMYTDADVARLRLLRGAVDHGHSIGRLAGLSDTDLRHLAETVDASAATGIDATATERPSIDTAGLRAALRRYDATAIDYEIGRLATILRPIDLLTSAVMPVLVRVGEDWHRGDTSIAHEHLMSSAVRHVLGSFLRLHARQDAPARLLFATLSGERHEIGTLGAAMLAACSGLGVVYLGPDLPARDIVESVTPAGVQVLVLGLTTASGREALERELHTVVRNLPPDVELWTGGHSAERYAPIISPRGLILVDYVSYQQQLVRIGGRVA